MRDSLSLVISAYNEEDNIPRLHQRLRAALDGLPLRKVEYLYVDDGSTDQTLAKCRELQQADPRVRILRLWRNFGHETAMSAGLDHATGDAILFLDADLQHPPEMTAEMVRLWQSGEDLVLTRRDDHAGAPAWRRWGSRIFYRLMRLLSDTPPYPNMPDFRLLGQKYVRYLRSFDERDYLFRGFLAWGVPLEQAAVLPFEAPPREAGQSKYNLARSLGLAMNSILQFSVKPLYLSIWLAVMAILFAMGAGVHVLVDYFGKDDPTPGFATIVMVNLIMGASNLLVLAILGAYIGKIHMETKKRPPYMADTLEPPEPGQPGAPEPRMPDVSCQLPKTDN